MVRNLVNYLLPPSGPILLGLGGYLLLPWRRNAGRLVVLVAMCLIYGFSIPMTASLLHRSLQVYPPLQEPRLAQLSPDHSAILVLAGGLYTDAPEYRHDTLHLRTLGRLRYGARLARLSGLPILVSGGIKNPEAIAPEPQREAELMAEVLVNEYAIDKVWVEKRSRTTWENAVNSAALLTRHDIQQVVLVTQAAHMIRAVEAFETQGLRVLPAPTLFVTIDPDPARWQNWLPSASAVENIYYACHEWLGIWYYRLVLHPSRSAPQEGSALRN